VSHIHNSDGPKGPASMLTRFSHCVASAAGRVLMIGLTLATASHMDAVQAQTDRSSHRLLNSSGHGLADLQSQAQLLTRLRMLTEAGGSASGTNPGIADPRVQQALQQMLTQQLRESLPPSTEPGTGPVRPGDPDAFGGIDPSDPDFQAMIERLSRSTGQPFDDMVRQWMESNQAGTAPPSPQPGRPPSGPGQEPREIPNPTPGGTPTTQPGSSSGRTMTTGPEAIDPETQKQRIAELVRMIEGLGRFTGPAGSNPGGSPGRTPNRGPEPRSTPGTQPGSQNPEREPWFWEPSDDQQQQATGRPQPADTGLRQDAPEPEEPEVDVWQKLGRIAQRAQSRSTNIEEETSGATDQSNAGVRSALARAIEETARDLAGRTDEFLQNRERERFQSRHDTSSSDSDFFGGIGRMTDSANDWVVDISDAGNSGGHRLASAADSDSGSSFPLIALVLMSLILTTGICLYRNREALNRQAVRARLPEIPRHLRDRGDVVQAFHALAARCPEALHEWWTHRRAAIVLARVSPEKSEAVQTLARLYEEARYTPQDREFTEQQLDSARRALRRFGES
jgi:hypothetical protein